jgi:hypothetical protein
MLDRDRGDAKFLEPVEKLLAGCSMTVILGRLVRL